jgi:hypothetical protein
MRSGARLALFSAAMLVSRAGAQAAPAPTRVPTPAQAQRPPAGAAAQAGAVPVTASATGSATSPGIETLHVPANETPKPAVVQWEGQLLHISAANSSLQQILTDVSSRIGAKLEGMSGNGRGDERVFGEYGPGEAREILADLLHGTAYNVMLIGDQGEGTPREIVLSPRGALAPNNAQQRPSVHPQESDDDADTTADDQPVEPVQPPVQRTPVNQPPHVPQPPQQPQPGSPPMYQPPQQQSGNPPQYQPQPQE